MVDLTFERPLECLKECGAHDDDPEGELTRVITMPHGYTEYLKADDGWDMNDIWDDPEVFLCGCCQHVLRDVADLSIARKKGQRFYADGNLVTDGTLTGTLTPEEAYPEAVF